MNIINLSCPYCKGRVSVAEGDRLVECPYCQQASYLFGTTGQRRYQVRTRLDAEEAKRALHKFLRGLNRVPGLAQKAELQQLFPIYLPFWVYRSQVAIWIFGELTMKNDNYRAREVQFIDDLIWTEPACNVAEFGVQSIELEGRKLEALDLNALRAKAMVIEPLSVPDDAVEAGQRAMEDQVEGRASLDRVYQVIARHFNPRLELVYYPIWVARYHYRKREYQVVIDGVDGVILYGKAPGNVWLRSLRFALSVAMGIFVAIDISLLVFHFIYPDLSILTAIIGLAIILAAYAKYRHGAHVFQPRGVRAGNLRSLETVSGLMYQAKLEDIQSEASETSV